MRFVAYQHVHNILLTSIVIINFRRLEVPRRRFQMYNWKYYLHKFNIAL